MSETWIVFIITDEQVLKALERLENFLHDETLFNDWKVTHNARQVMLTVDNTSINDYISRFQCLKVQDAKKLV